MRIPCPFCGPRDVKEYVSRGEVSANAPLDADVTAAVDALYVRKNVAGRTQEYFYHAQGCRSWLVVERDVRTHDIFAASFASQQAKE